MEIFYHGSPNIFSEFDLSHALEGDGKVKFGYGVYVTSHYRSAAHYAGSNPDAKHYYVYTVAVPSMGGANFIAFKQPVNPYIVALAEEKLETKVPEKYLQDGKDFRKFLAKRLTGKVDLEGEKAASQFLLSIGVDFIVWPYNWKNPNLGTNRAILDDQKVRIQKVEEVDLDEKKQFIEGSERAVKF